MVAHHLGVVGVAGSNPVVPILNKIGLHVEPTVSKCILISTAQSSPRAKQNPVVPILNKIGLHVEPTVSKCILISTAQSSPRAKQNPVVPILN